MTHRNIQVCHRRLHATCGHIQVMFMPFCQYSLSWVFHEKPTLPCLMCPLCIVTITGSRPSVVFSHNLLLVGIVNVPKKSVSYPTYIITNTGNTFITVSKHHKIRFSTENVKASILGNHFKTNHFGI